MIESAVRKFIWSQPIDNSVDLTIRSFPDKNSKQNWFVNPVIDNETCSEVWEFEVPNTNRELKAEKPMWPFSSLIRH
jgi:hypothetical protein